MLPTTQKNKIMLKDGSTKAILFLLPIWAVSELSRANTHPHNVGAETRGLTPVLRNIQGAKISSLKTKKKLREH